MRLIDADTLVKGLSYLYTKNHIPVDMRTKEILTTIMEQPTAYDIDKVVEELEDRVNEANNNCLCEMHENGHTLDFEKENGRIKGLKEAIEIVKQGGVGKVVEQMNKRQWKKQGTKLKHNGHYASYVSLFLGKEIKGKPHFDRKWLKR